jgi:predicted metal-dependent hydrolase
VKDHVTSGTGGGETPLAERAEPFAAIPLAVRVVRSARRRKTAQARLVDGVIEVRVPVGLSATAEAELVEHFRARLSRQRTSTGTDLAQRAAELARAHDLPAPHDIRWVSNQARRWGSCTPSRRTVRISDRAAGFPPWVLDYLVVHELAHLVEANHSPAFWRLVARYPLAERARGFLIAKGWDEPAS